MTPLHFVGSFIRDTLGLVPLGAVRLLFVAVPVALLIWVLRLPRETTTPPEGTGRWDENLKIGASVALVAQIVIYSVMS